MIREVPIIAFDGTHASGKTTLKFAVAAYLREKGINCSVLSEPARTSPLVDDVVLRDIGTFDLELELDLIAAHITQSIRATRNSSLILSDRTPANVIAYSKLLVSIDEGFQKDLFQSVEDFVKRWMQVYDVVFYCQDYFCAETLRDNMRNKVLNIQHEVDMQTQLEYENAGIALEKIPLGLSGVERTKFVIDVIEKKYGFWGRC